MGIRSPSTFFIKGSFSGKLFQKVSWNFPAGLHKYSFKQMQSSQRCGSRCLHANIYIEFIQRPRSPCFSSLLPTRSTCHQRHSFRRPATIQLPVLQKLLLSHFLSHTPSYWCTHMCHQEDEASPAQSILHSPPASCPAHPMQRAQGTHPLKTDAFKSWAFQLLRMQNGCPEGLYWVFALVWKVRSPSKADTFCRALPAERWLQTVQQLHAGCSFPR